MSRTARSNGPTIDDRFSARYYRDEVDHTTTYRGVPIIKCPFDLWSYQEIIHETKPTLVIETGAFLGGSALFLADMLRTLPDESGRVLSVELMVDRELPDDERIEFLLGMSSTAKPAIEAVRRSAKGERVMVILDSDHSKAHVLHELDLYAPLVSQGCYLIVEDTNVHAYPPHSPYGEPGPMLALKEWQPKNRGFEIDRRPERWRMSQNPGGYLKKVR